MKCTNKHAVMWILLIAVLFLPGCGADSTSMAYQLDTPVSAFAVTQVADGSKAGAFARDLCVGTGSSLSGNSINVSDAEAALLCDISDREVLYQKNAYQRMNPASLTKVLTAIVALKHGNPDDRLTASENVKIEESGASLAGIEPGDTMTLDQALHALLIPSGNDAAVMIAEHIAGSEEGFLAMMNEEAHELGATGCHFMNPHGLTADDHYVTAYDMYLIFNEAIKYDEFLQIISQTEYTSIYHDSAGNPKTMEFKNTNNFLNGNHAVPDGVVVLGGKTGTTNAAGSCLVLLSKDSSGNPYISVILKCSQRDYLYDEMYSLISTINDQ
ncbi:MAG: D-alanyl-D-alanine carboxypeptidase [Lachnospiraceae bacterium]|nr:D-alanyl-D-alanine carboxypeptidase [Lachnospiraceae bacterium]